MAQLVLGSHTLPAPQLLPHESAPPQPSPTTPQYLKSVPLSQLLGTQVLSPLHRPSAPQTWLVLQWLPHLTAPPQPSPMSPQ